MGQRGLSTDELEFLDSTLEDMPLFHDEVQLRHFIVTASGYGTVYGLFRQVRMELAARDTSSRTTQRERACARAELEYARARARAWAWTARGRRDRVLAANEADKWDHQLRTLEKQQREIAREIRVLIGVAKMCRDRLGVLTPEREQELAAEFWVSKLAHMLTISMATGNAPDGAMLEHVMALPDDLFAKLVKRVPDTGKMLSLRETLTPEPVRAIVDPTYKSLREAD